MVSRGLLQIVSWGAAKEPHPFDNAVDKARDLMKANMAPQAIELLQKEILENPTNAEAHLELGNIFLEQGNYRAAGERFKGVAGLEPKFSKQIGERCAQTGYSLLDRGQQEAAVTVLNMAILANPALRKEIAQHCFDKGMAALNSMTQNTDSSTSKPF